MENKEFRVEIVAYTHVDAHSKKEAEQKVRDMFEEGELTYEDLSFDAIDESEED